MGCGSSSIIKGGIVADSYALDVILKFPCATVKNVKPDEFQPQVVVGRITNVGRALTSPYSCRQCAVYRIDIEVEGQLGDISEGGGYKKVYSEVRAVTFDLRDPDDATEKSVQVPGKLLHVKHFNSQSLSEASGGDGDDDSYVVVTASSCTPSMTALLERCQLKPSDSKRIRIREICIEDNSQVGVFGVVAGSFEDNCSLKMRPLQSKMNARKKQWSQKDEERFESLASGDRSIIVLEDRKFLQGLKVRPFVGLIPQHSKSVEEDVTSSEVPSKNATTLSLKDISPVVTSQPLSSDDLALRSTNSVIRSPVASEDVCVQIPRGAAPGSKISVPGPHGVISITVPDDYKPDELYIVRVSSI